MNNLTAVVDKNDIAKLQRLFDRVETLGINTVERLIDQTIIHAAASAANATKPRKGRGSDGNIRGGQLRKKDLYRPLVKMPPSMGHWYTKNGKNAPFKTDKELSKKEVMQQKLVKVTKGIKFWEKGKGWSYKPYAGKHNIKNKEFKIPYAGLAKEAWKRGFKKLGGKGSIKRLQRNKNAGTVYYTKRKFMYAEIANLVSYVSKSSRGSARYGLNRAANKMEHLYKPRIEKKLQRQLDAL